MRFAYRLQKYEKKRRIRIILVIFAQENPKKQKDMKVLLINGSPRANGNTFLSLSEVAKTLNAEGIETEIASIGKQPVPGCIACGMCGKTGRCTFHDRVFYSLSADLKFKPAASVVVCRRGGASASFDRLNKYFTMTNMPVVSSQYWNMVYGQTPGQAALDEEGMQTMRTLGRNMAWMVKSLNMREKGHPQEEPHVWTNFIR